MLFTEKPVMQRWHARMHATWMGMDSGHAWDRDWGEHWGRIARPGGCGVGQLRQHHLPGQIRHSVVGGGDSATWWRESGMQVMEPAAYLHGGLRSAPEEGRSGGRATSSLPN